MASNIFSFLKVDEFFTDLSRWAAVGNVTFMSLDAIKKTIDVRLGVEDRSACLLLQFVQKDVFRLRFDPAKSAPSNYTDQNTRSVVMDDFDSLRRSLEAVEPFDIAMRASGDDQIVTTTVNGSPVMKVIIGAKPFSLAVFHYLGGQEKRIWRTVTPALRCSKGPSGDYAVVQTAVRVPSAVFVGFGEQGGRSLVKNGERLNFFSFDNYTYNQVYGLDGEGPLDEREPLYHADPFFMELNGESGTDAAYAQFVDNPAQVFVDTGVSSSSAYMIGTRFGDFDYYFFLGRDPADLVDGFTTLVGKARLKPRYALGYHQGCYGYEDRGSLEWVASKYREYDIPLDGLHIDVDIQQNYRTFTINTDKFNDPKGMFAKLKAIGVKCATNITPIISNTSDDYGVYAEGLNEKYFVTDHRCQPIDSAGQSYQQYGGGNLYNTYEANLGGSSNYDTGRAYVGEVNYGVSLGTTGHYPDLARNEVRRWWGAQYQYLFNMGLEMVWQDMTTPAIRDTRGDMKGFPFQLIVTDDFLSNVKPTTNPVIKVWNLYSYNLHKATYHGLNNLLSPDGQKCRSGRRNLIVGRGSFTGMHRFAALWTGDNASNWDFLRINVAQVLALGLCGQAMAGQDIGGFASGEPNQHWVGPELLMRWTMAGAFLPWFRNHYFRKGQKDFQEPFQYVEWFKTYDQPVPDPDLYAMVVPVCRYYIQRRYRLIQMFYDLMFENTLNGMPICRPLFVTDPGDPTLYTSNQDYLNDQFCVGNDFLVAPILDPQTSSRGYRKIYLPAGSKWYCYMDDIMPLTHSVTGGTTVTFDASLGAEFPHIAFLLPTYVREGAVIPSIELENYVGERCEKGRPNPVTFNVYPGKRGARVTYLDDGINRASAPKKPKDQGGDPLANDEYRKLLVSHHWLDGTTREIQVTCEHNGYLPPESCFYVALLRDPDIPAMPTAITLNGKKLTKATCQAKEDIPGDNGWCVVAQTATTYVKIPAKSGYPYNLKIDYNRQGSDGA